jgi:hypothetical protein
VCVCLPVFNSNQSVNFYFGALFCEYKICRQDEWMQNTCTGILALAGQSKKLMLLFCTNILVSTDICFVNCELYILSVIYSSLWWPFQPFADTPLERPS